MLCSPRVLRILVVALAGLATVPAPACARHVVIAVIDGPRAGEFLEEPGRPHAPQCDGVLIPAGSWIPEFRAEGWTHTMNGHAALVTGTRQDIVNDGTERPDRPTLFELVRKHAGAGPDDVWVVAGKAKIEGVAYSDHPDYGAAYGARVDAALRADAVTYAAAVSVLQTYRPAVTLINFASVDLAAHSGSWPGYLDALSTADSLVGALWAAIEADPVLGGDTDLFVAADHGRHDDAHGGFEGHGDDCEGCRRLPGIALGPDFRIGYTGLQVRRQEDVAATAAWILGVSGEGPPMEGYVMAELLANPPAGGVAEPAPPLPAAFPNPFHDAVAFSVPGARGIEVIDIAGRRVWSAPAARGPVTWTGRDAAGAPVPAGVYWVRVRGAANTAVLRVVRTP